jgi:class I fructose-bisphosphate aldolase
MSTTLEARAHARVLRLRLEDLDMPLGKRARLHRLLYGSGLGNGTLLVLPIDQGIEHGPLNFFPNPAAKDPEFQWRLALEGGYNALACHWGLARFYMHRYAGRVPLILKINGKTNVPDDTNAFSPLTASVEDAVSIGAYAVGYTLYVGSPRQDDDIDQFRQVREACDRWGMPLVVWAYPRGSAIEEKGGRDSLYAVDYAARLAHELGADIIKLNVPKHGKSDGDQPKPYNTVEWTEEQGIRRIVESAGRSFVLFSGGSKIGDDDLLEKASATMAAGATGLIFGRNMWQRPMHEALALTARIREILREYPG